MFNRSEDKDAILKKIKNITYHENHRPVFDIHAPINHLVNIRPDKTVSLGKFKQDPLIPNGYLAHPITIRAIKKDIFVAGNEFIDLEQIYKCPSCHNEFDIQFWNFCPFCEASFNKNSV